MQSSLSDINEFRVALEGNWLQTVRDHCLDRYCHFAGYVVLVRYNKSIEPKYKYSYMPSQLDLRLPVDDYSQGGIYLVNSIEPRDPIILPRKIPHIYGWFNATLCANRSFVYHSRHLHHFVQTVWRNDYFWDFFAKST
ncbi:hypothetical protein M422DRAFT_68444 [Sphaerobolus stellatus SS14]|uniref:Uncharacterized protein n=1 Tax=Sphaerobolus stellatus (strain SS14) TaxID=990650 RepID=A0A0C9UCX1_SPHS4|nr:hypothetical protein M422DRAFT_68444 [Sphaerobolus stellatus SS14]